LEECDDFILVDGVVHVGVGSNPVCGNFGGSECTCRKELCDLCLNRVNVGGIDTVFIAIGLRGIERLADEWTHTVWVVVV
jgi:hypothetical protein